MEHFSPGPETARAFRDALGRYATGVTVVTTDGPDGRLGITANSFTALSLDPALVIWCPARRSARFAAFRDAAHYAIHVLAADQRDLALRFARTGADFGELDIGRTSDGMPLIGGVLARFDCRAHAVHDGGDHAILVGEVVHASMRDGEPLIFWGGRYGDFLHQR